MKDTMIMEIHDGHWVIPSDFLGDLMVRFGESSDTISASSRLPWYGDANREIINTINNIKLVQPSLYIFCRDQNRKVIINGVVYHGFSFEVKKYNHIEELSVFANGKKSNGSWSDGMTSSATIVVKKQINDLFYDNFDKLAESCRDLAIDTYKKKTAESLQKAANNIEATQDFLKGLDA